MAMRIYQAGEIIGIALVLGATAMQMFYLDPLKRDIEWRLASFSMQQNGEVLARAQYDTHIETLKALNASQDRIAAAGRERDTTLRKFATANANISDFMIEKERVEDYLQWIVIALFAVGSLLAGAGRVIEMSVKHHES